MKVRINKTTRKGLAVGLASLLLVVSFQNCGKAGFDSELDSNLPAGLTNEELNVKYGTTLGPKVAATPFAYDVNIDTISYNSCSGSQLRTSPAFFSIKAGSYNTAKGGTKLSDDFFTYANSTFNPIYPATTLSEGQLKEYLADSPENGGVIPTLAIRMKSDLTGVYTKSNTITLGTDVVPMLDSLTDAFVMDALFPRGNTPTYFPFANKKVLEGSLTFNTEEQTQDGYRNVLMSSGVLTLTYLPPNGEKYAVRAPSSASSSRAYGKGYYMNFIQSRGPTAFASTGTHTANPTNTLSSISEVDLNSNAVTGVWGCESLRVVTAADALNTSNAYSYCPPHTYAELSANTTAGAALRAKMEIFRRHFPANQWEINFNRGCAYPKGSVSCYKEDVINNASAIEYITSNPCFREGGTVNTTKRCMQYITACARN